MDDEAIHSAGSGVSPAAPATEAQIIARIERLPFSGWHARTVGLIGLASFFDAFDALTIAFVLPVLAVQWRIPPSEIGLLIATGYVGQLIGAVLISGLAERIGRLGALRLAVAILSLLSVACAFAGAYVPLLILRLIQGMGLGAEVPIAATYINELCPTRYRGRLVFSLQVTFAMGVMATSLIALWVIPTFGWEAMFYIGGFPIVLALFYGWLAPESPRWLASRGRLAEAGRILADIERAVSADGRSLPPATNAMPPPVAALSSSVRELFINGYAGRTFTAWTVMFCTSFTGYGLLAWLPTIYRTVYKTPVSEALQYSFISGVAGFLAALLGVAVIDVIGRRATFAMAFVGAAIPLLVLFAVPIGAPIAQIVTLSTISIFFISILLAGVYAYVPEIYPTQLRALGAGMASSWLRIASIVGPLIVGFLLTNTSINVVFLSFGVFSLIGAAVTLLFLIETRGRLLEEIAAPP